MKWIVVIVAGLACAWLILSARAERGSFAADEPAAAVNLTVGPISYFQDHCMRCHGDYGANFGPAFAKNKTDEELTQIVGEMSRGPGAAPLEGIDLAAQVAFHRAISRDEPFIAITRRENGEIKGEVTEGSTVTITVNGRQVSATVDGPLWSASVRQPGEITATRKAIVTRLRDGLFSHKK